MLCDVNMEPEEERLCVGFIGSEDYLSPSEEINTVIYEQGLVAARELDEKLVGWRREADKQDKTFIDLISYENE